MLIRQLFEPESSTYTYLLADGAEAILIDPVRETVDRDMEQLTSLGLTLVATVETHVHADHITGAWPLKQKTGCRIAVAKSANASGADVALVDGDAIKFGNTSLNVVATPGHTSTCLSFVGDGVAFTGDALLI